jgi:hypothetical protein
MGRSEVLIFTVDVIPTIKNNFYLKSITGSRLRDSFSTILTCKIIVFSSSRVITDNLIAKVKNINYEQYAV